MPLASSTQLNGRGEIGSTCLTLLFTGKNGPDSSITTRAWQSL